MYLLVLLPAGALFLVAALAESGRVPFDLPECESELVAGYFTEYSSLKYAMFPMGEYVAMCAMAAIAVHFFMGGYLLPNIGGVELTNWLGETHQMIAAVSLGYPDESPGPRPRKALGEVMTWV